jgi:transposase-like protein
MTDTNDGKLVRLDCLGRIRFSREQREALLDGYESSGLSGPEVCGRHGVKYQTFATWRQKRRNKERDGERSKPAVPHSPPVFFVGQRGSRSGSE